jgi:hypothetical protein
VQFRRLLLGTITILLTFNYLNADTLMKGKHPVVIGRGDMSGKGVQWTDCEGNKHEQYLKPPYWVEKNDNCTMTPQAFGIEQKDGKYVVARATQLSEYVPGVRNGDEISFSRLSDGVRLMTGGHTVELYSAIARDTAYGGSTITDAQATGCLSSEDGRYMLKAANGRTFSLNSTDDLSRHVGHNVVVHGTVLAKGVENAKDTPTPNEMAVSSLRMISEDCKGKQTH